jgi:hypothetical protein
MYFISDFLSVDAHSEFPGRVQLECQSPMRKLCGLDSGSFSNREPRRRATAEGGQTNGASARHHGTRLERESVRGHVVHRPTQQRRICAGQGERRESSCQRFAVRLLFRPGLSAERRRHRALGGFGERLAPRLRTVDENAQSRARGTRRRRLGAGPIGIEQITQPAP